MDRREYKREKFHFPLGLKTVRVAVSNFWNSVLLNLRWFHKRVWVIWIWHVILCSLMSLAWRNKQWDFVFTKLIENVHKIWIWKCRLHRFKIVVLLACYFFFCWPSIAQTIFSAVFLYIIFQSGELDFSQVNCFCSVACLQSKIRVPMLLFLLRQFGFNE